MRISLILLIPVLALIGCGQKGPLYMPKPTAQKPTAPKPIAPQPSAVTTPDPQRPTPSQAVPPPE